MIKTNKIFNFWKQIPWYGWASSIWFFALNIIFYYSAGAIVKNYTWNLAWNAKIPMIDDHIPLFPYIFVQVYFLTFPFWWILPIIAAFVNKKYFLNWWICFTVGFVVSFFILCFLPVIISRENFCHFDEIKSKSGFSWWLLKLYYQCDGSKYGNCCFPSYHCMITAFCWLGIVGRKEIKVWIRYFVFCFSILIYLSTLFTKQHYFLDMVSGIGLALVFWALFQWINLAKYILKRHPNFLGNKWQDRQIKWLQSNVSPNTHAQKLLTIVTCCFNSTKTIDLTIQSIDFEKNKDIQIFIIDDGSTDGLKEHIDKYIKKYPHSIFYFRKENGNWGSCINFAIKHLNSQYMAILDSDDVYNFNSLNKVLEIIRKNPYYPDLIGINYQWVTIDQSGNKIKNAVLFKNKNEMEIKPIRSLSTKHVYCFHSMFFKSSIAKKINPLPQHVSYADTYFMEQILFHAQNFATIKKDIFLYGYCTRLGQQTIYIDNCIKKYCDFEIVFNAMLACKFSFPLTKMQRKILKMLISNFVLWMFLILAFWKKDNHSKIQLYKKYYQQICQFEKDNLHGKSIKKFPVIFSRLFPRFAMFFCKTFSRFTRNSFLKASGFINNPNKKKKK